MAFHFNPLRFYLPINVSHKPKIGLRTNERTGLGLQSLTNNRPPTHFELRWNCSLNDQSGRKMLLEISRILRAARIAGCGGHPPTNYARIAAATQLQWRRESSTQGGRDAHAPAEEAGEDELDAETVQVEYRGKIIRAKKGSILRSALLRNGASPHNDKAMYVNCRGLGTCGTCAVQVVGKVVPEEWGNQEQWRFKLPPHNSSRSAHLRLACQVRVEEDLKVIKYNKFWGQGDVALGPLTEDDFKLPLGQLEYMNDRDPPNAKKS